MYSFSDNKNLLSQLENHTRKSYVFGSNLYNLTNQNSDIDYLHIINNINTFYDQHHGIQFKKENEDHNFVTINQFVRNIIEGDTPTYIEIIFSKQYNENPILNTLLQYKNELLFNKKTLNSYLGYFKRDCKYALNVINDNALNINNILYTPRIIHIVRSYYYLNSIMYDDTYPFDLINNDESFERKLLYKLKNKIDIEYEELVACQSILVVGSRDFEQFKSKVNSYPSYPDLKIFNDIQTELNDYTIYNCEIINNEFFKIMTEGPVFRK